MKPRPSIERLKNYQVKDLSYRIKLDANETRNYLFINGLPNLEIDLSKYPDHESKCLRQAIASQYSVPYESVVEGNGSSEIIELLIKSYIQPNDVILAFDPTFSMYEVYANIYDATYVKVPSEPDFSLNLKTMKDYADRYQPKMIFLCSPNNPTGYQISKQEIIDFLQETDALVVVDEAYMEFATIDSSVIDQILANDRLAVLRTFSKAYGLASLRLGYMIAHPSIAEVIHRVKSPYHVNQISQMIGTIAMTKQKEVGAFVQKTKVNRMGLATSLSELGFVIYPSEANFLFVKSPIAGIDQQLNEEGILIRHFDLEEASFERITIGTSEENEELVKTIRKVINT